MRSVRFGACAALLPLALLSLTACGGDKTGAAAAGVVQKITITPTSDARADATI